MQLVRSLVGLLYVGLGIYVWITKKFVVELSETAATAMGLVLVAYGLFRGYMAFKSYRNGGN